MQVKGFITELGLRGDHTHDQLYSGRYPGLAGRLNYPTWRPVVVSTDVELHWVDTSIQEPVAVSITFELHQA